MLLAEIVDLTPSGKAPNLTKERGKKLGSGAYGTAYDLPGPVGKVVKIGSTEGQEPTNDGYLKWAENVFEMPNPFFPQIERVAVYDNRIKSKKYTYHAVMEKLVPNTKITEDEALYLLNRYLNFNPSPELQRGFTEKAKLLKVSLSAQYMRFFAETIRDLVKGLTPANVTIKDPNLIRAINLMKAIHKQGFMLDLHRGNIMFRRTPYGVQPVITDPFNESST